MQIEVVIKPNVMRSASIVWEPLNNSLCNWWCSHYIDREMYKEKHYTTFDSYKKLYNTTNVIMNKELKKGTEKLRRIIREINEYIEDPKDYFPIKSEDVNLKINSKSRQQLNEIHRYFVRIAYPTTAFNKAKMAYQGPRQKDNEGLYWAYNWHMDRRDYSFEEPYKKYPGDFYIERSVARKFVLKVQELNYGCHDIEPFFYYKSNTAKNMIDHPGLVVHHNVSQKWRNKWYEIPPEYYSAGLETTKKEIISFAKKHSDIKDIPPYFEHFQSCEKHDVWMPQNCILGKSVSIAYIDEDDPFQYDVNNGHQTNFGFEFTDRGDRDYLRKIGYGGKKTYGWPLGRITQGREVFEELRKRNMENKYLHNKQVVKEIKVWK
tara:strand:+ start:6400 stop:7527 length:1128 start_codon:yes stop_codon:yes gene_type:complete